jgi:transposase
MLRRKLDDKTWARLDALLAKEREAERGGRPPIDDRNFLEAVFWMYRTGAPWRDLPSDFGPWKTVFNRFDRWAKSGKWGRLFHAMRDDPDGEWHSVDSTINRVHQHASGGRGGPMRTGSAVVVEVLQARST